MAERLKAPVGVTLSERMRAAGGKTGRIRMGGRAVEGTGLENRQGRKSFVGSNPTPSAITSLTNPDRRRPTKSAQSGVFPLKPRTSAPIRLADCDPPRTEALCGNFMCQNET